MKRCPEGHIQTTDNDNYCSYCGEVLESLPKPDCPECGKPVLPNWKYCMKCGALLK